MRDRDRQRRRQHQRDRRTDGGAEQRRGGAEIAEVRRPRWVVEEAAGRTARSPAARRRSPDRRSRPARHAVSSAAPRAQAEQHPVADAVDKRGRASAAPRVHAKRMPARPPRRGSVKKRRRSRAPASLRHKILKSWQQTRQQVRAHLATAMLRRAWLGVAGPGVERRAVTSDHERGFTLNRKKLIASGHRGAARMRRDGRLPASAMAAGSLDRRRLDAGRADRGRMGATPSSAKTGNTVTYSAGRLGHRDQGHLVPARRLRRL